MDYYHGAYREEDQRFTLGICLALIAILIVPGFFIRMRDKIIGPRPQRSTP